MMLFKLLEMFKSKNKGGSHSQKEQVESSADSATLSQDVTTISLEEVIKLYKPDFIPGERVMDKDELKKHILYSVALGDISGSRYEGVQYPNDENYQIIDLFTQYHHFTDDTAMTVAIYKATQKIVTEDITDEDAAVNVYTEYLKRYVDRYPSLGYGSGFLNWALSETDWRNCSYGNGSCMRVGGIAALFDSVEDVIKHAYYSALPSHSHKDGIKGAICTTVIYWMLAHGASKNDIIRYLEKHYPNDGRYQIHAHTQLEDLVNMNRVNPWSTLSVICQTSVTEAVINFLESDSFESCLRNSYRYLCDRDTIAAISGPMAAIFYKEMNVQGRDGEEVARSYLTAKLLSDIDT